MSEPALYLGHDVPLSPFTFALSVRPRNAKWLLDRGSTVAKSGAVATTWTSSPGFYNNWNPEAVSLVPPYWSLLRAKLDAVEVLGGSFLGQWIVLSENQLKDLEGARSTWGQPTNTVKTRASWFVADPDGGHWVVDTEAFVGDGGPMRIETPAFTWMAAWQMAMEPMEQLAGPMGDMAWVKNTKTWRDEFSAREVWGEEAVR